MEFISGVKLKKKLINSAGILLLLMTRFRFKKMDIQSQLDHRGLEHGGWFFWKKALRKSLRLDTQGCYT